MSDAFKPESVPPRFGLLGPRWAATEPLWSAGVTLLAEPSFRAARPVYAAREPRDATPGPTDRLAHFPGTLLVRVRIDAVRLRFGGTASNVFTADVETETTLLVAADPA